MSKKKADQARRRAEIILRVRSGQLTVTEAAETRLELAPQMMSVRRQTVEHPIGTLKSWMGYTHFLTRRLRGVSTEMSLHVLAYNFKRLLNLMGPAALISAIQEV